MKLVSIEKKKIEESKAWKVWTRKASKKWKTSTGSPEPSERWHGGQEGRGLSRGQGRPEQVCSSVVKSWDKWFRDGLRISNSRRRSQLKTAFSVVLRFIATCQALCVPRHFTYAFSAQEMLDTLCSVVLKRYLNLILELALFVIWDMDRLIFR